MRTTLAFAIASLTGLAFVATGCELLVQLDRSAVDGGEDTGCPICTGDDGGDDTGDDSLTTDANLDGETSVVDSGAGD
jgi:hypothetical protein